jgi:hypothetical protein
MAKHTSRARSLNRRDFLKAGLTGGAAVAALSVLDVSDVFAVEVEDSPQSVFGYGVWVERLATTFYYTVLTRATFSINAADRHTLKLILDAKRYHLQALAGLGGMTIHDQFYLPAGALSDRASFGKTAADIETALAAMYLAGTRRLGLLCEPRFAATAAQFAASAAAHLALVRSIGGFVPNDLGLPVPIFFNTSDGVLTTMRPYWNGDTGYIGPMNTPTDAQIDAVLGDARVVRVPTFTAVY